MTKIYTIDMDFIEYCIYIEQSYSIYPIGIDIFPIGYSLLAIAYSLLAIPCWLFPIGHSLCDLMLFCTQGAMIFNHVDGTN